MSLILLTPLWLFSPFMVALDDDNGAATELCDPKLPGDDFVRPNMLMGHFTYGQVKLMTLAWNAIAGRGIQALMAWGSYRIVLQGITRIAEATPVEYRLLTAVITPSSVFQRTAVFCRGMVGLKGWRPKFMMGFLLYSLGLLVAMPSIFEVSAGYVRPMGVVVVDSSSSSGDAAAGPVFYVSGDGLPRDVLAGLRDGTVEYACRPDQYYKWGFVMNWFFMLFAFFAVWVFGMFVVWMDAQHNSRLTRVGRQFGGLRGVVDLADAVRYELGPHTSGYSDEELRKELGKRAPVRYYILQDDESERTSVCLVPEPVPETTKV